MKLNTARLLLAPLTSARAVRLIVRSKGFVEFGDAWVEARSTSHPEEQPYHLQAERRRRALEEWTA